MKRVLEKVNEYKKEDNKPDRIIKIESGLKAAIEYLPLWENESEDKEFIDEFKSSIINAAEERLRIVEGERKDAPLWFKTFEDRFDTYLKQINRITSIEYLLNYSIRTNNEKIHALPNADGQFPKKFPTDVNDFILLHEKEKRGLCDFYDLKHSETDTHRDIRNRLAMFLGLVMALEKEKVLGFEI
jgi:hypothetical protein